MIDAGAGVSEERDPTNPLREEPSVFNDLSSGFGLFPHPPIFSADRKIFSIVPGGFTLQILSAGFSFCWPFF